MAQPDTIKRCIDFDRSAVEWFDEQYPRGSLTGIMNLLLVKFREVSTMTAADYAKLAAESLREELRDDSSSSV